MVECDSSVEDDTDEAVIWDIGQSAPVHRIWLHNNPHNELLYTPDGRHILYGIGTKTVHLLDSRTFKILHKLEGHGASVTKIAVSPDGKRITLRNERRSGRPLG